MPQTRKLRRRVNEDRVNSTATRRLVHKRRRNILRNFADELLQNHGIVVLRRSDKLIVGATGTSV